jgi:hypothetical protein
VKAYDFVDVSLRKQYPEQSLPKKPMRFLSPNLFRRFFGGGEKANF